MKALLFAAVAAAVALPVPSLSQDRGDGPPPKPARGGFLDFGEPETPDPAPGSPPKNAPRTPETPPAPQPTPQQPPPSGVLPQKDPPAPDSRIAGELKRLRDLLNRYSGERPAQPRLLKSTTEAIAMMRKYRSLVDRAMRQPMLEGEAPSDELKQRVKELGARWGDLAGAIRAGKPPRNLSKQTLDRLRLRDVPVSQPETVPMTGDLWAKISDQYFQHTLGIEDLAAREADYQRRSASMRELRDAMESAEAAIHLLQKHSEGFLRDHWLRAATNALHKVWRLGVSSQIKVLERQANPDPDLDAVAGFLRDMDAARGLRHSGTSLEQSGGAPPPDGRPKTLTRQPGDARTITVPAEGTIRGRQGDAVASVDVAPAEGNRLPELAEELYHTHYTLRHIDDFLMPLDQQERLAVDEARTPEERQANLSYHLKSRRERLAHRQRAHGSRRVEIMREMTQEADRVLASQR